MKNNCVICKGRLGGPICLSCFEELQQQVLEGARLIALQATITLELSKRLGVIELGKTVEQQSVRIWRN